MKQSSKRGFTLLELMIATAIFSVVMIAIYSSWSAIVRGSKMGLDAAAAVQRSRIAMRTIEDALLTTQLYTENMQHYSFFADTTDPKFAALSLTAQLPATFLGSTYFGDETVRRVTFSVEEDPNGIRQLMMRQAPLLRLTNDAMYSVALARDVNLFVIEFWDAQLGEWTDELLTTNQLPKMVRVSLSIGPQPKSTSQPLDITSRVIAIPSIAVPAEIQKPATGS